MVQVLNSRFDGVPEFASLPALLQSWYVLLSDTATSPELFAVEYAIGAVRLEREARREAELAFFWVQQGSAHFALDWYTYMTKDFERALWHWGQAAVWLNEHGVAERVELYQPLLQQVVIQQQRLSALVERMQGQITRSCQEWGITLSFAREEDEEDAHGDTGATY